MRWLFLFLSAFPVWACQCARWPSAKEAWLESPLVIAGRVERTDPEVALGVPYAPRPSRQAAWLHVEEAFKGAKMGQTVLLEQPLGSCTGHYQAGERYVFYLQPSSARAGAWEARGCHRTRLLEDAGDDLRFLRALPKSAEGTRLSGTVNLYEKSSTEGLKAKGPLSSLSLRVVGQGQEFELHTDSQGVYEKYGLPPGDYRVVPSLPKGLKVMFAMFAGLPRAGARSMSLSGEDGVPLAQDLGVSLDFAVIADTQVTGRVTDPEGRPMKGVCVEVESLAAEGPNRLDYGCTKADGVYTVKEMPPGTYRIVANRAGKATAATPFPAIYYPGTPDRGKALIVEIGTGAVAGLDIRIPRLLPRISHAGRLLNQDGEPMSRGSIVFDGPDQYRERAQVRTDGTFRLEVLAGRPGQLQGEIWPHELESRCGAPHPSAPYGAVHSPSIAVAGDASLSGLVLTLPIRKCEPPK